jgi:hypothetical protein
MLAHLTLEQLQARTGHCHLEPCAGPGCACVCTSCSQTDLAARTAAKAQRRSQAALQRVGKPGVATAPAQAPEAAPELTSADLEAAAAEALASLQPTSYLADEEDLFSVLHLAPVDDDPRQEPGFAHLVPDSTPAHVQHESTFVMTEDGPVQLSDVVLPPNAVP